MQTPGQALPHLPTPVTWAILAAGILGTDHMNELGKGLSQGLQ